MMIDIRYVQRIEDIGGGIGKYIRVLQVRYIENPTEFGIQDPIWGEWQDVRIEDED